MDDPVSEGGRVSRTNTREEILREAARLFAVVGYKATSLTDVASAVGCSKATLLYHFESKDAIFDALVEPAHSQLQDLAARLAILAAAPAREAAIVGFVDLVRHIFADPSAGLVQLEWRILLRHLLDANQDLHAYLRQTDQYKRRKGSARSRRFCLGATEQLH